MNMDPLLESVHILRNICKDFIYINSSAVPAKLTITHNYLSKYHISMLSIRNVFVMLTLYLNITDLIIEVY